MYKFYISENKDIEDEVNKKTIKEMVDIHCQQIIEDDDQDVMKGMSQIFGKDSMQMDQSIMQQMKEKHKRNQAK